MDFLIIKFILNCIKFEWHFHVIRIHNLGFGYKISQSINAISQCHRILCQLNL